MRDQFASSRVWAESLFSAKEGAATWSRLRALRSSSEDWRCEGASISTTEPGW
jgi:hypothetical protein